MDNYCLALSTAYNIKMAKLIGLDESGYLTLCSLMQIRVPPEVHRVYWNGSEWVDEVITTTPSNEETSNGFVYASNDIELFVGQSDRVERWKFDGTSWTKVEDIMTGVQTFRPVCIRNYNDELKWTIIVSLYPQHII